MGTVMGTVTVNGVQLNHIYGFERVTRQDTEIPEFINVPELVLSEYYYKRLTEVEYKFRTTDAEKWTFDQALRNHSFVTIEDTIFGIYGSAWITSIKVEWKGEYNVERPWQTTMKILIPEYLLEFYSVELDECGNPIVTNNGTLTIDGKEYNFSGDPNSPLIVSLTIETHTVQLTISGHTFYIWVVKSGNISIDNTTSNPTTITVNGSGIIWAEYEEYW